MKHALVVGRSLNRRDSLIKKLDSFTPFEHAGTKIEKYLKAEIEADGVNAVLQHLYMCGAIPEALDHDSTEEKVFSKYTDALLTVSFSHLGLIASTLEERADSADVQVKASNFSFVADAKAFRLSRTAKNQKDFKIEAMDKWRGDCDFAVVVAPVFQLPTAKSQIYEQAIRRKVCLLTYTHLRALLRVHAAHGLGPAHVEKTLRAVLGAPGAIGSAGKDAAVYWRAVNKAMRDSHYAIPAALSEEAEIEAASVEGLKAQEVASLEKMEKAIRSLTHDEAVEELVRARKIRERKGRIEGVGPNSLLGE